MTGSEPPLELKAGDEAVAIASASSTEGFYLGAAFLDRAIADGLRSIEEVKSGKRRVHGLITLRELEEFHAQLTALAALPRVILTDADIARAFALRESERNR